MNEKNLQNEALDYNSFLIDNFFNNVFDTVESNFEKFKKCVEAATNSKTIALKIDHSSLNKARRFQDQLVCLAQNLQISSNGAIKNKLNETNQYALEPELELTHQTPDESSSNICLVWNVKNLIDGSFVGTKNEKLLDKVKEYEIYGFRNVENQIDDEPAPVDHSALVLVF
jgi:hypothetical protein